MIKKALIAASLAMSGLLALAPASYAAVIGFTDGFAPGNWTTSLNGTPPGGGAPAGATNNGTTLTLTGGDSGPCTSGPCLIAYTISVPPPNQQLLFHWSYATSDDPQFDNFGYTLNGILTQLSDPLGSVTQSGDQIVSLASGSTFGWYLDCTDCTFGNAVATITGFAAVPEPGTVALLSLGFAAFAGLRRRRSA